jgi:glycosyltransferase involved in cell wall biosynthesis
MMLAKGLAGACGELTIISFPTVAAYPNGPDLIFKKHEYCIDNNIHIVSAPMINIQLLKQRSINQIAYKYVKKWLQSIKEEKKIVLIYSDYPPYANACRKACSEDSNASCVLVMTDLPTYSLTKHKLTPYSWMMCRRDRERERNYSKFDAYIVLTRYMIDKMGITERPNIVVEGFADPSQFAFEEEKNDRKTMMYAGALSNIYNIRTLVDAIRKTTCDADFWFFGDGDQKEYVVAAAKQDSRIKYFGKVSRNELLHAQKKAHILISAKSSNDEHTKYAFPSKILEYMTSGTAVLTTKVMGIPDEYFDYVYTIEDESIKGMAATIEMVFEKKACDLAVKGQEAVQFVSAEKNYRKQGERIVAFLKSIEK